MSLLRGDPRHWHLSSLLLGFPLLLGRRAGVRAALKAFPRSPSAAWLFFGGGAVWFLYNIWNLSSADFGDYHVVLFIIFGAIAVFAFKCVPDFLAVRGVCLLVLLCAAPLLEAAYMEYRYPQRLFMVGIIYLGIALAICLGAQPWRGTRLHCLGFQARPSSRARIRRIGGRHYGAASVRPGFHLTERAGMTLASRSFSSSSAGPSGSGKSTLCDRLVDAGMGFSRVVTTTTRRPRDEETDGVHYFYFFPPEEFDRRITAGANFSSGPGCTASAATAPWPAPSSDHSPRERTWS